MKSSTYYFHMKTKTGTDFEICISVPLSPPSIELSSAVAGPQVDEFCIHFVYIRTLIIASKSATTGATQVQP